MITISRVQYYKCHYELTAIVAKYNSKKKKKKMFCLQILEKFSQLKHIMQGVMEYALPSRGVRE